MQLFEVKSEYWNRSRSFWSQDEILRARNIQGKPLSMLQADVYTIELYVQFDLNRSDIATLSINQTGIRSLMLL